MLIITWIFHSVTEIQALSLFTFIITATKLIQIQQCKNNPISSILF